MSTKTSVKKSNAKFKRMTAAQKRVAIAEDALKWIASGIFKPMSGVYLKQTDGKAMDRLFVANPQAQLRTVDLGKCEVCAVGAMFVAKSNLFNAVKVKDVGDYHEKLRQHFSETQLALIEAAFELTEGVGPYDAPEAAANRAVAFGARYANDTRRLKAILQNIIDNGGTFVP